MVSATTKNISSQSERMDRQHQRKVLQSILTRLSLIHTPTEHTPNALDILRKKSIQLIACLTQFLFVAEVITVVPESLNGDFIISEKQLRYAIGNKKREAVVIRTLPNTNDKLSRQYAHTNPPYLTEAAAIYLREKGR